MFEESANPAAAKAATKPAAHDDDSDGRSKGRGELREMKELQALEKMAASGMSTAQDKARMDELRENKQLA